MPKLNPTSHRSHFRLTDNDYAALAEFRRAIRNFLAFSAQGAEERGLTSQQHQALLAIRANIGAEPMSISALAEELSIKNHSAIGLVARLVEGGYARRASSDLDKRRVVLTLTPAGETVLEEISQRNLAQLSQASQILEALVGSTKAMTSELHTV